MMELEICVESVESAIAAERGGAQRVELCSALSEGGITPSSGLIRCVRAAVTLDVFVIIRPRGGDFVYTNHEFEVMGQDIRDAQALGANGVVFGLLTEDDCVDQERMLLLVELARPLSVTFHRAFDVCEDLDMALEDVISVGADRVLTSGGRPDALSGAGRIAQLRESAGSRIRIMAGGGVRTSNVAQLVQRTGVLDVHTSLNSNRVSAERESIHPAATYSQPDTTGTFVVQDEDVRIFKAALDSVSGSADK
jgi:copper homeostasis protein